MFEFIKNEQIVEMSSKETWGQFALDLHHMMKQDGALIQRCDMLKMKCEDFGVRTKCIFTLPGIEWIKQNQDPNKFSTFPIRSNGVKYAIPGYLDLIKHQLSRKTDQKEQSSKTACNHFPVHVGSNKVQILIYGQNCANPFPNK